MFICSTCPGRLPLAARRLTRCAATLLTVAVLVFIVAFVLEKGIPELSLTFLLEAPRDRPPAGGVRAALLPQGVGN